MGEYAVGSSKFHLRNRCAMSNNDLRVRYLAWATPALPPVEQPADGKTVVCDCRHVNTIEHVNMFGTCRGCRLPLQASKKENGGSSLPPLVKRVPNNRGKVARQIH